MGTDQLTSDEVYILDCLERVQSKTPLQSRDISLVDGYVCDVMRSVLRKGLAKGAFTPATAGSGHAHAVLFALTPTGRLALTAVRVASERAQPKRT